MSDALLDSKAETFQPGSTNNTHGISGPLKISYAPDLINVAENFLEVAAVVDKERTFTDDTNQFFECEKYGVRPTFSSLTWAVWLK